MIIPYRDSRYSERMPFVTIALIIVNVVVFLQQCELGRNLGDFLLLFGLVPKKWLVMEQMTGLSLVNVLTPYITSLFLHSSWPHLISNMLFLWIFGDNLEDNLGHFTFLFFYLLCGLMAEIIYTCFNIHSVTPAIGASGAVAGIIGAYWVSFPRAKVRTLICMILFNPSIDVPAWIVMAVWFGLQTINSFGSPVFTAQSIPAQAFWLYIGGLMSGIAFIRTLFPPYEQPHRFAVFA